MKSLNQICIEDDFFPINDNPSGDYDAEYIGDAKYRMIPSGDVVRVHEKNRRLTGKDGALCE